jgi:hypothetical protein
MLWALPAMAAAVAVALVQLRGENKRDAGAFDVGALWL